MGILSLPNNPFAPPTAGLPDDPPIDPQAALRASLTHVPGDTAPPTVGDLAAIAAAIPAATPSAPFGVPATGPLGGVPAAPAPTAPPVVDPAQSFQPPAPAPRAPRAPGANPDQAIIDAGNAQAKAITEEGQAQKEAADAEAEARRQGAEQLAAQQRQLQEQRVQRDADVRQLNQDTTDALEKAHKTTVPDFWEGKEGQAVTASILVGLGAVGQGLTAFGTGVNVGNNAQNTINHAVDSYYERKRDEINNLFKYAEAKGRLNDQQKLDWATKLNDTQYDLVAAHQSIQDHLQEVAAQGRGKIDQAHFAQLSAENQQRTQQLLQAAQMNRAQINHMKNQDSIGFMNASSERLKATTGASDKEEDKQLQLAQSTYGKKAEIARNRVDGNADLVRSLQDPNIGPGELRQKLEQAMALNQGEGKRGVSTASLHFVAPKLVSATGKFADDFDTLVSGKSGQEMRKSILKIGQTGLEDAHREYEQQQQDFKKGAVATYYKTHPEKVGEHLQRFYPERAPETRTVVPRSGQYAGKTVTIDGNNNILKVQ